VTASATDLPRFIESTLFAPDATRADIEKLCSEARAKSYRAVCVNGSRVELAYAILEETDVQIVALVGFPFGAADADAKRYEAETAIDQGAHEIDFVINLGRLRDGDRKYVLREMRDLVESADERPVKAVLESHLLTSEEKILACELTLDSGVHFVAASTGFLTPGATLEDVKLLRSTLGESFGVKACANAGDQQTALTLLNAGATRLGWISE